MGSLQDGAAGPIFVHLIHSLVFWEGECWSLLPSQETHRDGGITWPAHMRGVLGPPGLLSKPWIGRVPLPICRAR